MASIKKIIISGLCILISACSGAVANPTPVPREYFGMHMHRTTTLDTWPNVEFATWRLWDAGVTWANLEPQKGNWDFSRLDQYVVNAGIKSVEIVLPLAHSPTWASSNPTIKGGYAGGVIAPPANMSDWSNYVRTLAVRYKGKIKYWEIWNEPSDPAHYSGSLLQLKNLACEAYRVLKEVDPSNKIISPASNGGGKHLQYLDLFLMSGGKNCIDIVGHHFYVFNAGPEAMVPLIKSVRLVMKKNKVESMPLWNTETGWWIRNNDGTPPPKFIDPIKWLELTDDNVEGVIQKALLLGRAEGLDRFIWYAWDNQGLGFVEPTSKMEKKAVSAWRLAYANLLGSKSISCSQTGDRFDCQYIDRYGVLKKINWNNSLGNTYSPAIWVVY